MALTKAISSMPELVIDEAQSGSNIRFRFRCCLFDNIIQKLAVEIDKRAR